MKPVKLITLLLSLLLMVTMLTSTAQAALLDVGPVVPQVLGSTEGTPFLGTPPLGHGYPLWYRDSNRVPLELCLDRLNGQCATFEPNTAAALRFPDPANGIAGNFTGESFWWSADAIFSSGGIDASLGMALEAAFSTGDPVPNAQVSFARVRIRVSGLPVPGLYTITTPYKLYTFNVVTDPKNGNEINFTEDIGIAEGGVFTGLLNGAIDPFMYCAGAPFTHSGGLYLAPPLGACPAGSVRGGSYPSKGLSGYEFRVQGPGVNIVAPQFVIIGKIFTGVIPTPLAVDKATYALNAGGMQINAFASTQALSNQTGAGVFPLNFALNGTDSALEFSGTDIPTKVMTTNSPGDGKFFATSGFFTAPATTPTSITVTNTADTPNTAKTVALVDEVNIDLAYYNSTSNSLQVAASSADKLTTSVLQVFIPGEPVLPIGTIVGGQLTVNFPVTLGAQTYNIPPETVKVTSSLGGSATATVSVITVPPPPLAVADSASTNKAVAVAINVLANDTAAGTIDPTTVQVLIGASTAAFAVNASTGVITYTPAASFTGTDTFSYRVRDAFGQLSNTAVVTVTVHSPPLAVADAASAAVNATININVIGNDSASNSSLNSTTVNIVSPASCGTIAVLSNGTVDFTAPATVPAAPGTCSFDYVVSDIFVPSATSNTATVTVAITLPLPPVAVNDAATVEAGSTVIIPVLINDTSAVSTINPATLSVSAATSGSAVANLNGTVSYTAPATAGSYSFSYTVKDNAGTPAISNVATVAVTVNAIPVTIISPNGGEALTGFNTQNVTWIGQTGADNYILYYSATGAAPWTYVANVGNVTSYNWSVPNITTATARFRVQAFAGTTFLNIAVSNANFSITAVSLFTITSPNGGEALTGSSLHNVTWTAQGGADNYILYYSATGAAPWTYVANVGNVTSYSWAVPNTTTATARFRIQAFTGATYANTVVSNANFNITASSILGITSPNGGETLVGLSTSNVTWSAQSGADNYILYYSATGAAPWTYVANVGNVTSYNWVVPSITTTTARFRIQAFSGAAWLNEIVSNANFNITP